MPLQYLFLLFLLIFSQCQSEAQKSKEKAIDDRIEEVKQEMKVPAPSEITDIPAKAHHEPVSPNLSSTDTPKLNQPNIADDIIGVWEVKNDYYFAIYEVEKYKQEYIGKIHYYNDGSSEYKGKNSKEDYFMSGLIFKDNKYQNGTMYMPDGSKHAVRFDRIDKQTLHAHSEIEGSPYTETWKKQQPK